MTVVSVVLSPGGGAFFPTAVVTSVAVAGAALACACLVARVVGAAVVSLAGASFSPVASPFAAGRRAAVRVGRPAAVSAVPAFFPDVADLGSVVPALGSAVPAVFSAVPAFRVVFFSAVPVFAPAALLTGPEDRAAVALLSPVALVFAAVCLAGPVAASPGPAGVALARDSLAGVSPFSALAVRLDAERAGLPASSAPLAGADLDLVAFC